MFRSKRGDRFKFPESQTGDKDRPGAFSLNPAAGVAFVISLFHCFTVASVNKPASSLVLYALCSLLACCKVLPVILHGLRLSCHCFCVEAVRSIRSLF